MMIPKDVWLKVCHQIHLNRLYVFKHPVPGSFLVVVEVLLRLLNKTDASRNVIIVFSVFWISENMCCIMSMMYKIICKQKV